MAEPSKPGWGGKRRGAGRKPKAASPTAVQGVDLAAALAAPVPEEVDSLAAGHGKASIEALVKVLVHGSSDAAKLDAAIAILDRGYGKPTVEAGADPMLPFLGRAPVRSLANELREESRRYAILAFEGICRIADSGATEAVRVRANKARLDRGFGTVTPARVPAQLAQLARPLGKKAEAAVAAKAAGVDIYTPRRGASLQ